MTSGREPSTRPPGEQVRTPLVALNVAHQGTTDDALSWWRHADRSGVAAVAIPDSPALMRDLTVHMTLALQATRHTTVMAAVTNPQTRDPSVTACALATLSELAPGRVVLGIGTGDSALWGVGRRPATVARLREYIVAVKALLRGETASYDGRSFAARWSGIERPVDVPIVVAVAGPATLRMACEVADGALLSMGCGPDNVAYVRSLIAEACDRHGRDPDGLQWWWNSEIVFGPTVEAAMERGLGVSTAWLAMGTMDGKQIPEDLRGAVARFSADSHDLTAAYRSTGRGAALVRRARELGLEEWLRSRAPGLWGPPGAIAARLRELAGQGMDRWMFYVGREPDEVVQHVRSVCDEVMPLLGATTAENGADLPRG